MINLLLKKHIVLLSNKQKKQYKDLKKLFQNKSKLVKKQQRNRIYNQQKQ